MSDKNKSIDEPSVELYIEKNKSKSSEAELILCWIFMTETCFDYSVNTHFVSVSVHSQRGVFTANVRHTHVQNVAVKSSTGLRTPTVNNVLR